MSDKWSEKVAFRLSFFLLCVGGNGLLIPSSASYIRTCASVIVKRIAMLLRLFQAELLGAPAQDLRCKDGIVLVQSDFMRIEMPSLASLRPA